MLQDLKISQNKRLGSKPQGPHCLEKNDVFGRCNERKHSEVQSWTSGPSIKAVFYTSSSSITRITLAKGKKFTCHIFGHHFKNEILEWMERYANQEKGQDLPLDFSKLTPFAIKSLLAIKAIPFGSCASYGKIAALAGQEKGARAIGNVCHKNPFPLVIPCHRVIQKSGSIGGFSYPLRMKRLLLNFEAQPKTSSLTSSAGTVS